MYNGENHMVLGANGGYQYAPEETPTMWANATISIITDIVNIGRWQGYKKWDEEIYVDDACCEFTTEIKVKCLYVEDWDDDMGTVVVADDEDLYDQVRTKVEEIDNKAYLLCCRC